MNDYFIRKKVKNGFRYIDKHNKSISKKSIEKYLTFYIPPAYDNVKINKKKGKVLAIGYDDKNRPQYIYDKSYTESQSKVKFKELKEFGKNYNKIINKIKADLYTNHDSKNKQISMVLMIMIDCNFRIGNDKYTRDNKSYGVTTLEKRHVKNKNGEIIINFIGKKGIKNTCRLTNKKIIKNLTQKKRTIQNKDRIFSYRNKNKYYNITSRDVNNYLKKMGNYSTKFFRTWNANVLFIKESKKCNTFKECVEKVAKKLHHTPSICNKNYLDPKLINFYKTDIDKFNDYFNKYNYNYYLIHNY